MVILATNLLEVRDKVQRILNSRFGTIQIDKDGDFTMRHESARLFIRCWEHGDSVVLRLTSPIVFGAQAGPELFKYIATEGTYIFGNLYANEGENGCTIVMHHSLLGDYLDEEELVTAVVRVLGTANELDDDLAAKFGGTVFHED